MATVRDLSGNSVLGSGTDDKLEKPNRTNAGSPQGAVTPAFPGEIVHDTTNNYFYRSYGTAASQWERILRE